MGSPTKRITRLAVVSKEYTTFYVINHTFVNERLARKIELNGDVYEILDDEDQVIAEVDIDCPKLIDYKF